MAGCPALIVILPQHRAGEVDTDSDHPWPISIETMNSIIPEESKVVNTPSGRLRFQVRKGSECLVEFGGVQGFATLDKAQECRVKR